MDYIATHGEKCTGVLSAIILSQLFSGMDILDVYFIII